MNWRRELLERILILCLIVAGGLFRGLAYGDLRLSVGNSETPSYIGASKAPLFSWQSFAGKRLFTTNLVYKLANDPKVCKLKVVSYPASGAEVNPAIQPCFAN